MRFPLKLMDGPTIGPSTDHCALRVFRAMTSDRPTAVGVPSYAGCGHCIQSYMTNTLTPSFAQRLPSLPLRTRFGQIMKLPTSMEVVHEIKNHRLRTGGVVWHQLALLCARLGPRPWRQQSAGLPAAR